MDWFQERKLGQRLNIILVAEGAVDRDGQAITADKVKTVSVSLLNHNKIWKLCSKIQMLNSLLEPATPFHIQMVSDEAL